VIKGLKSLYLWPGSPSQSLSSPSKVKMSNFSHRVFIAAGIGQLGASIVRRIVTAVSLPPFLVSIAAIVGMESVTEHPLANVSVGGVLRFIFLYVSPRSWH
jgi:hypothetical protein